MANPSDPVATGLVVAGTLGIAKRAEDFLAAISGHPGESIGTIVGGWAKKRIENLGTIAAGADLILLELGVNEPAEIALNVLQPAVEAASLQDSPTLREIWANMLANAADPRNRRPVVVASFVAILKDLEPPDVKFLQTLYMNDEKLAAGGIENAGYTRDNLLRIFAVAGLAAYPDLAALLARPNSAFSEEINADYRDLDFTIEILLKHRILDRESEPVPVNADGVPVNLLQGQAIARVITQHLFRLSELGRCFVRACERPT